MFWIPYHSFILETALNPKQGREQLASQVEPPEKFRFRKSKKPYEGTFSNNEFKICRLLYQEKPAPIIIHGRLLQAEIASNHMQWQITLKLGTLSLLILLFASLAFALIGVFSFFAGSNSYAAFGLLPVIVIYFFVLFHFNSEIHESKKFLLELLRAREVDF